MDNRKKEDQNHIPFEGKTAINYDEILKRVYKERRERIEKRSKKLIEKLRRKLGELK